MDDNGDDRYSSDVLRYLYTIWYVCTMGVLYSICMDDDGG